MELPKTSDTNPMTPEKVPQPQPSETPPVPPVKKEIKKVVPVAAPVVSEPPSEKVPNPATPAVATAPAAPVIKKSILPGTILSQEEKIQISLKKKNSKKQVEFLKHLVFLLTLMSAMWFVWVQINVSEGNGVLSVVGVEENVGQKVKRLKQERTTLKLKNKKLTQSIKKTEKQLKEKTYTRFSTEIENIRAQQIRWFDEVDNDGNVLFGFIDAVPRMQAYFNSGSYEDPNSIISGPHNKIEIENLQVSRDGVNFSVLGSQILKKVFYLNIEFVEMVNSFPFLKNGKITQFSRQTNDAEDEEMMRFGVRLEHQLPNEVDNADQRFNEYTTWLNSVTTQ